MALALVAVGGKVAAAAENNEIGQVNRQTLTAVSPTSVSGTGVAVSSGGLITLTAATTPVVEGCFTATYDRYVIEIDGVASANASFTFVFRVGGVDVTSANYDSTELLGRNSLASSATAAAGASWTVAGGAGTLLQARLELAWPALAQATQGIASGTYLTNPAVAGVNNGVTIRGLSHRLTTAYDGFKLTLTAGAFTGTISISGKNKN